MEGVLLLFRLEKNSGKDRRSIGWMEDMLNHEEYDGMISGCVCEARYVVASLCRSAGEGRSASTAGVPSVSTGSKGVSVEGALRMLGRVVDDSMMRQVLECMPITHHQQAGLRPCLQ